MLALRKMASAHAEVQLDVVTGDGGETLASRKLDEIAKAEVTRAHYK